MSRLRSVALVCISVLAIAACGSDSSVDAQPYIDAVAADLAEDGGPTEEDAECIAESIVGGVGADTLDDNDITPEEFAQAEDFDELDLEVDTEALQADLEASLADCALGDSFVDLLLSQFPVQIADDDRACIADALDANEELTSSLAAGFAGTETDTADFEKALASSLAECPEVLGGLIADSIQGAGIEVDEEARACIINEVAEGGAAFVEAIVDGGAASQQLGEDIGAACLPDATG